MSDLRFTIQDELERAVDELAGAVARHDALEVLNELAWSAPGDLPPVDLDDLEQRLTPPDRARLRRALTTLTGHLIEQEH